MKKCVSSCCFQCTSGKVSPKFYIHVQCDETVNNLVFFSDFLRQLKLYDDPLKAMFSTVLEGLGTVRIGAFLYLYNNYLYYQERLWSVFPKIKSR